MSKVDLAYVIQATDVTLAVKVGFSSDPVRRFNSIRLAVPFGVRLVALLTNGKQIETEMIGLLSSWRMRGEWFQPRTELNQFLADRRHQHQIVERAPVDQPYSDNFIKPAVLQYLGGRQPTLSEAGDLVYRFLREGSAVIVGREKALQDAIKGTIAANVLHGYVPLPETAETPAIFLPETVAEKVAA